MNSADGFDCRYDDFERIELLGSGGNADVHKARTKVDGKDRVVALKTPRMANYETVNAAFFEEFVDEAETWAKLGDHENVVSVLDWGSDPIPWIALEYMEAGNLAANVDSLSLADRVRVFEQACDAVFYAHQRGVSHHDLKPENVLLTRTEGDLVAKVGDWGLAKQLLEHSKSKDGLTLSYSAPEQVDQDAFGPEDHATDIYQLGVIAYELFAGQHPITTETAAGIVSEIIQEVPPGPSTVNTALPPAFDDAIMPALEKQKEDRYETVPHFRDAVLGASSEADPSFAPDRTDASTDLKSGTSSGWTGDRGDDRDGKRTQVGQAARTAPNRLTDKSESNKPSPAGSTTAGSESATGDGSEGAVDTRSGDQSGKTGTDTIDGQDEGFVARVWSRFAYPTAELDFESNGPVKDISFAWRYARTMDAPTLKRGALVTFLTVLYGVGSPFAIGYSLDVIRRTARTDAGPPAIDWRQQFKSGAILLVVAFGIFPVLLLPAAISPTESGPLVGVSGILLLLWMALLPAVFVTYGITREVRTALHPSTLRKAVGFRYLGMLVGVFGLSLIGYVMFALSTITLIGMFFVGFVILTALAAYVGRRYRTLEFGRGERATSD